MTHTGPMVTLSPRDGDAILFDLDVVEKAVDGFLEQRAAATGEAFVPFDIEADYRRSVDSKPRDDGVATFLESRGIALPFGAPEDGPEGHTVCTLDNLKDHYFLQHLEQHGVGVYEAAIALGRARRAREIKTALRSSSNNCAAMSRPPRWNSS